MRSRLFTDTGDFDRECGCPPGQICVCIRLDRDAYFRLCRNAAAQGVTTGGYIEQALTIAERTAFHQYQPWDQAWQGADQAGQKAD